MKAIRETEKAVLLKLVAEVAHIEKIVSREVWFPKSQINNGVIREWVVDKKVKETFSHDVCDITVLDADGKEVEIEVSEKTRKAVEDFQKIMRRALKVA